MTSRLFKYAVYGNIYISVCAVIMFNQTNIMFSLNVNRFFLPFVFFSTLSSYSLHWALTRHQGYVSGRLKWSYEHKNFLIIVFTAALIISFLLLIRLAEYYMFLLPLAFITFVYTAPKIPHNLFKYFRNIIFLKTTYLTLVWVFTTCILPVLVSSCAWKTEMVLFIINRLFLIFPICLLFDYRDREEDIAEGIKNIATLLSEHGLNIVFAVCMILTITSAVLLNTYSYNLFLLSANIVPSLLLAALFKRTKHSKSDILFYFYLDGLMMISGILVLLKSLAGF